MPFEAILMLDKRKGIALFTDGSSYHKDGSGGWAYVAIDAFGDEVVGSGSASGTTNNRMEMQAWVEGLNWVFETLGPCKLLVYSDSEYVGLGAMDRTRMRRKNDDLWFEIDSAIDRHKMVEFVWVKGHRDSHYNILADELAGQARRASISKT
jgi:ribonuclease HI